MNNKEQVMKRLKSVADEYLPHDGSMYLYGSRARGDANDDSDWDVLVILNKNNIDQNDYDCISYQLTELGWHLGEMIIPVLYTRKEWEQSSFTPFYKNVEREKIMIA